jgi:uncharacterized protein YndB with AHSA1/START domain
METDHNPIEKKEQRMDTLTTTITINCPVDEIFNWLTDFANHKQWQPNLVEAEVTSPGPLGVGATYRYVSEVMGRRFPSTGEVTAYEPNRVWGQKSHDGPAPVETIYQFEPGESSTKLTVTMITVMGGFPSAGSFVKGQLKKSLEEQNERLKQIMED